MCSSYRRADAAFLRRIDVAKVFFVKDGHGDEKTSRGYDVPIASAVNALRPFEFKYFPSGPTFNPEVPAGGFSPFRYVVIEVLAGEVGGPFPKAGFYLVADLSPARCGELLGIVPPSA